MLTAAATAIPLGGAGSGKRDLFDTDEYVPELVWPASLTIYDQMRRGDAQIASLWEAITLPVLRRRFEMDPNGAADEDVRRIAEDLGCPVLGSGDEPGRGRARFNMREHFEQALLALAYGSYWFEQVGEIVDGAWRLRKLAPRPTKTLESVQVDQSGGLAAITQTPPTGQLKAVTLDVGRIVGYVWKREGANWYGTSILRSVYGHWWFKRDALKSDAVQKRRNSLGIPVFNPGPDPSDETKAKYDQIGRALSSGQEVSVVLHSDAASFTLQGVEGTLPDPLQSVRYHDESIAAAFLAMWMKLGTTQTGSRALGDTLLDVFNAALDAIANDFLCDTFNEYVIRDWMLFNYGPEHGRAVPKLVSTRVESPELAVADLVGAVKDGLIKATPQLEAHLLDTYNLPGREDGDETTAPPPAAPAPLALAPEQPVAAQREQHVHAAALDDGPSTRERWRDLTEREVHAAIDPHSMDQRWRDAISRIVAAWGTLRRSQVDALARQIIAAQGDVVKLARLEAPAVGGAVLLGEMQQVAEAAAADVVREAAAQGTRIGEVDLARVSSQLVQRAESTSILLAQGLSQAASKHAIRLSGPQATPEQVADAVRSELAELKDSTLALEVQGSVTEAQMAARVAAHEQGPAPARYVATEIMDLNTCSPCAQVDGREYASLAEAQVDYPTGGYYACDGADRCRGFLFAEYDTSTEGAV